MSNIISLEELENELFDNSGNLEELSIEQYLEIQHNVDKIESLKMLAEYKRKFEGDEVANESMGKIETYEDEFVTGIENLRTVFELEIGTDAEISNEKLFYKSVKTTPHSDPKKAIDAFYKENKGIIDEIIDKAKEKLEKKSLKPITVKEIEDSYPEILTERRKLILAQYKSLLENLIDKIKGLKKSTDKLDFYDVTWNGVNVVVTCLKGVWYEKKESRDNWIPAYMDIYYMKSNNKIGKIKITKVARGMWVKYAKIAKTDDE